VIAETATRFSGRRYSELTVDERPEGVGYGAIAFSGWTVRSFYGRAATRHLPPAD
jgi:hypothetical protein